MIYAVVQERCGYGGERLTPSLQSNYEDTTILVEMYRKLDRMHRKFHVIYIIIIINYFAGRVNSVKQWSGVCQSASPALRRSLLPSCRT